MAQRQVVLLEDDIQGGEATETLQFGYDGTDYEIDLNAQNAADLRQTFEAYTQRARRVGSSRQRSAASTSKPVGVDNRAVRAWAASNRVPLNSRGRIPRSVIEQYRAAGN